MSQLSGKTAVVVGGSSGFGRGVVEALAGAGMNVVAVGRDRDKLGQLEASSGGKVRGVSADATSDIVAAKVIEQAKPAVLVITAGATGTHRPTRLHTWDTFSEFWNTDMKIAFAWTREALLLPLEKGSSIVIGSSTAAWSGFPLLGAYAPTKAAAWGFARCVAGEAEPMGIRVHCMLPVLTPDTDMGADAIRTFAGRMGVSEEAVIERMELSPPLTAKAYGEGVAQLITDPDTHNEVGYKIDSSGMTPMSQVST